MAGVCSVSERLRHAQGTNGFARLLCAVATPQARAHTRRDNLSGAHSWAAFLQGPHLDILELRDGRPVDLEEGTHVASLPPGS